jgi:hypothetical protein
MANDFQDIGQWFQNLATRSIADQMRAAQRYAELLQRLGRGELFAQSVRDEYLRFVREETTEYARNLAALSLNYYQALDTLGRTYNDRFFDQVLGARPNERPQPAVAEATAPDTARHAAVPRQVELALHAPLGAVATRSFVLENKQAEPAEISFLVSDFVGPAGTEPFRAALQFEPSRFSIAPGEERSVTLRLDLPADQFAPGQRYTATVLVRGYDDLELMLHIWVDPPAPSATETGESTAPAGATRNSPKKRKAP